VGIVDLDNRKEGGFGSRGSNVREKKKDTGCTHIDRAGLREEKDVGRLSSLGRLGRSLGNKNLACAKD